MKKCGNKMVTAAMAALMVCPLAACGVSSTDTGETEGTSRDEEDTSGSIVTKLEKIDMSKWMYHADDNVYYQTGISYCVTPADASYETLAVFVPGDYFSGTDNLAVVEKTPLLTLYLQIYCMDLKTAMLLILKRIFRKRMWLDIQWNID